MMKQIELSKTEFDQYAKLHPLGSFEQTSEFANFKEGESWHPYFVALEEKGKILGATLLLAKETKILKKRFFYAPRGFLIDYTEEDFVKEFTNQIIQFIQKKKGILLKIDPYLPRQARDNEGNLIEGGYNHDFMEQNIKQAGFEKVASSIQPQWLLRLNLAKKTLEDLFEEMDPKARQIIRRNEKMGFSIRELQEEREQKEWIQFMQEANKKNKIIQYTDTFYQDLFHSFGKKQCKIISVEITPQKIIRNLKSELQSLKQKRELRNQAYQIHKITEQTYLTQEKEDTEKEKSLLNNISYFEKKEQEKPIFLGGYLFLLTGKEIVALQGAMVEEYIKFDASYTIHFHMINYALENNFTYYNLYEINKPNDQESPLYGSYLYKKKFGGEVVELIGEYDYKISPKFYSFYQKHFPQFYGVKTIFQEK